MEDIREKVIQIAKKENCKPRYRNECDGECNNCYIKARLLKNPNEPVHFAEPTPVDVQCSVEELNALENKCLNDLVD